MKNEKLLNTKQALERLNISRGTFFTRLKEKGIKPVNYNPALKKQHNPLFKIEDVDKLADAGIAWSLARSPAA